MDTGIASCFTTWEPGFCWEKMTEFSISTACLVLTLFQLVLNCRHQDQLLSLKYLLYITIILTLLCNIFHAVFFNVNVLFDLDTFFFNIYFVTIIYYFGRKVLLKIYKGSPTPMWILLGIYFVLLVGHVVLLVYSIATIKEKCVDPWYLIVRMVGFLLSIVMCAIGVIHQRNQKQRLFELREVKELKNPLPKLWMWISINMAGQCVNIIKSIVFGFVGSLNCEYSQKNVDLNYAMTLLVLIVTYYLPLLSTLYFFWKPYARRSTMAPEFSDDTEVKSGVQLMSVYSQMSN